MQINFNVSLVKTRLRASRRGEIPSPVGVRQPNPISVNLVVPNPVGAVCNRTGSYGVCAR